MGAPKMSEQEYMDRVAGLFEKIKAETATEDEFVLFERYHEAEFDLTVEYRLGAGFPQERREALRRIHRQSQNNAENIKTKYLAGKLSKKEFADQMQTATATMVEACKSVLAPDELKKFFGSEAGTPRLAISPDAL